MALVRKCPKCGTYNIMAKATCVCGQFIRREIPMNVDDELLQAESAKEKEPAAAEPEGTKEAEGEAEEKKGHYVQTCPNCRKEFVFASKDERLRRCTGCGKARIGMMEPVFVEDEEEPAEGAKAEDNSAGEAAGKGEDKNTQFMDEKIAAFDAMIAKMQEEDEKKETEKRDEEKPVRKEEYPGPLTIFSVPPYSGCKVTYTWEEAPVLLGRSAALWEFLEQDGRVSNEHCYLCIEEGCWCVKDNHSRNSTLLNNRRVSSEKGLKLTVGARITLGNQMDSMEFEVESV